MDDGIRLKKIIYTLIVVALLGAAGFYLYRYLFPAPTIRTPETRVTGRGLPIGTGGEGGGGEEVPVTPAGEQQTIAEQEQRLIRITDFPVMGAAINRAQKKIVFYQKDGGDLFSSDFEGKEKEKISSITIIGLTEVQWDRAGDRAAVFYLDNETLKGFLYAGTSSVIALPPDIRGFSWSPDGKSLAYLLRKDDKLNLTVADAALRNPRTVFTTPILDAQISWPVKDAISFLTAPSGLAEGFLFSYSRSSGAFNKILGPFFGLTAQWSPDGTRILTSSTNESGGNLQLAVREAGGKAIFTVSLSTLPEKCAWASNTEIICASPRIPPQGIVWPDEYYRGELNTQDRILSLDLKTKEAREILNEGNFDVSNISISEDRSYLVFVNRNDGTLWSLKLK